MLVTMTFFFLRKKSLIYRHSFSISLGEEVGNVTFSQHGSPSCAWGGFEPLVTGCWCPA